MDLIRLVENPIIKYTGNHKPIVLYLQLFPKRLYTIDGEPGHQVCQKSQTKPLMPSVANSRSVRTRRPHGRVLYSVLAGWCN